MGTVMNPGASAGNLTIENVAAKELSDSQLLLSSARGDDSAFSDLYGRYSVTIYNYLLRLTQDQAASEDLLQEVFVAVWQGAKHFKGRASVKTWIFRIAHNQAISWIRRQQPVLPHTDRLGLASVTGNPEKDISIAWDVDQLMLAMERLSPNHRAVVELAFVQGLSYSEIGQIMSCPVGTVKSRMSYALKNLDGLLKQNVLEQ